MKALVAACLFEPDRVSTLELATLFRMAAEGQHIVLPEPLQDPSFLGWSEQQNPSMRDEITFAIDQSLELESRHPPTRQIRIDRVDAPKWETTPVLPLAVALGFLQQPLVLLVENQWHDAAFLRCLADRFQRKELRKNEERGWLRFDHGGGLTEMLQTLEQRKGEPLFRRRTWFLFDSDALAPARPSKDSRRLRHKCEQLNIAHHQLKRRAAENYLPPAALERTAKDAQGRRKARAFRRMTLEQRSHFNMKRGLRGDEKRVERESRASGQEQEAAAAHAALFSGLDEADRTSLLPGFGSDLSKLFSSAEALHNHGWFWDDSSIDEIHPVIERLLGDR